MSKGARNRQDRQNREEDEEELWIHQPPMLWTAIEPFVVDGKGYTKFMAAFSSVESAERFNGAVEMAPKTLAHVPFGKLAEYGLANDFEGLIYDLDPSVPSAKSHRHVVFRKAGSL